MLILTTAIACTDAGRDLFTHGPQLPWLRSGTETLPVRLLPIVQYRPKCALKARSISERAPAPTQKRNTQSLAVFPQGYGRSLDWSLAKSDRMYALLEIFRLAAFSQKQLQNVLQQKIVAETRSLSANTEHPTMANLLYFRDILQDQLGYVSNLSRLTDDQSRVSHSAQRPATVDHGMAEVHSLFEDLRSQAQSLHERCTQGMTVISNNSMLEESQRAIKQAELVTKLTKVAFVYLPFTFTAGFFGMNFKELGTGEIHLWIYFVASLPLMFVTMAFYVLDEQRVKGIRQALQISDPDGAKQQQ